MSERTFIQPNELKELIAHKEQITIVDVRSPEEFAAGHVEGAINIPADHLQAHASQLASGGAIVTVCSFGGQRSCGAADLLQASGLTNVRPLSGGVKGWLSEQD